MKNLRYLAPQPLPEWRGWRTPPGGGVDDDGDDDGDRDGDDDDDGDRDGDDGHDDHEDFNDDKDDDVSPRHCAHRS